MHGRGTNIRTNRRMNEKVGGKISQTADRQTDRTREKKSSFFFLFPVCVMRGLKKKYNCVERM